MSSIDGSIKPALYSLVDLMDDAVKRKFYREELTKCSPPEYKHNFFEVEKVLRTKKIKGKKHHLVKFLYYPDKFNLWLSEDNFTK